MTASTTTAVRPDTVTGDDSGRRRVYSALTGVAALAVLLQGLWAGLFLEHDGQRDAAASWIDVHALGGEVAIVFAVLATAWALFRLRSRKDLLYGAIALVVLLVLESYVGGLIRDDGKDSLTPVHIPLAMVLMGMSVWLPLRAARGTSPR
jgi:MFS family permease